MGVCDFSERKKFSLYKSFIMYKKSHLLADCFLPASWVFSELETNIKCICFGSWIWVSGITIMLWHPFALSSFREPLPTLASLNRKWFRADLTFRDPCAKYFLRWCIPSLGIPRISSRSFTLWFSPWIYGNETSAQRISHGEINLQTSNAFVFRKIKRCSWNLYFRRNKSGHGYYMFIVS